MLLVRERMMGNAGAQPLQGALSGCARVGPSVTSLTGVDRRLGADLRLEIVRGPRAFAALASEWDALAAHSGDQSMFRSHAWTAAAWRRQQGSRRRQMYIPTIRDRGELVLAAPFVRRWDWIGAATLSWLDSLTPIYNDILVVRDARMEAAREKLWSHLRASVFLRAFHLSFVRSDAAIAPVLRTIGPESFRSTAASALDLGPFADSESFLAARSPAARRWYRRYSRLLEREGRVELQTIDRGEALASMIGWIFRHKRDWVITRFGKPNWLSRPRTETFFREVAMSDAERGGAWVHALTIDGEPIAAALLFRCGGTVFGSKITHDPRWAKLSPGSILLTRTIGAAIDAGADRFDFMIGEGEWKSHLASERTPVLNYQIPNGLLSRWRDRLTTREALPGGVTRNL